MFSANYGQKYVPRAVLIDLEPRVLNEITSEENSYNELFNPDNVFHDPTGGGAGNIWVCIVMAFKILLLFIPVFLIPCKFHSGVYFLSPNYLSTFKAELDEKKKCQNLHLH